MCSQQEDFRRRITRERNIHCGLLKTEKTLVVVTNANFSLLETRGVSYKELISQSLKTTVTCHIVVLVRFVLWKEQ